MKRFIAIVLAAIMIFAVSGCGKSEAKLKIINEELGAEEYGIAFRSGDEEVCHYIDSAVQELVKSGKYQEIASKDEYKDIVDNLIFLNETNTQLDYSVDISTAPKRKFTMGIDPEYNPFSYMGDDGNYTGFDVEICKAACELLGWEFEIFGVNWDNKLIQLDNKECDCIWSGMTILESMKDAGYIISTPYYYNTQVVVVKDGEGIEASKDLKGKIVAVQLGTSGESLLNEDLKDLKKTFQELVTCDSFLKCFTELESGAVDAVFIDYPVAKSYISKKEAEQKK